jgi:hypothetical protein
MSETAGWPTIVKRGGAAVTLTNEATTKLMPNTVYQITDATKRLLDPMTAVVVQVDADGAGAGGYVTADPSTYVLDYYTSKITFLADQGSSALVRVSGKYIPALSVGAARAVSVKRARTTLDSSKFGLGFKSFIYGRMEAGGDLELVADGSEDIDSGGGTAIFLEDVEDAAFVLFEIDMGAQGQKTRCWVAVSDIDTGVPGDGLVTAKLNWKASGRGAAAVISTT